MNWIIWALLLAVAVPFGMGSAVLALLVGIALLVLDD